jgi:hypothetical protein
MEATNAASDPLHTEAGVIIDENGHKKFRIRKAGKQETEADSGFFLASCVPDFFLLCLRLCRSSCFPDSSFG